MGDARTQSERVGTRAQFQLDEHGSLLHRGRLVMRNHPDELAHYATFIAHARGDVLLMGLGVGLVLPPLRLNHDVTSVTIVERFREVIDLCRSRGFVGDGETVLWADAFEYVPPRDVRYGAILCDVTHFADQTDPKRFGVNQSALIDRFRPWVADGGWIGGRDA